MGLERIDPKPVFQNFNLSLQEFLEAGSLSKQAKANKLANQVHLLARTPKGIKVLYDHSLELAEEGFFQGTAWADVSSLVPSLVKGTLQAGHPASSYEVVSELRVLAMIEQESFNGKIDSDLLKSFLEEVVMHNLEFALHEITEESRLVMPKVELQKATMLFSFLLEHIELGRIKEKLAEEIRLLCAQRPIVTRKVRKLIMLVSDQLVIDGSDPADSTLKFYVDAVYAPSPQTSEGPTQEQYASILKGLDDAKLKLEAESLGKYLRATGLSNPYLATLLKYLAEMKPDFIPAALTLHERGKAEWAKHSDYILKIINETVDQGNYQCIYGLARMVEKNLFSRKAVRASYNNLRLANIHPQVEKRILKSMLEPDVDVSARQYLLGATLRILGQPLGIGQGNNATCQSARGISLWSQYAPAKLINMVITVCTQNNLVMRFESQELESIKLAKGLVDHLDYQLDAVSAILVPHLDKIYNRMMQLGAGRGEDPHKWVNPAFYGYWVQLGFASAYNYPSNTILDFKGFITLFYCTFHPKYNGGKEIVYPVPVGIFITSSTGHMIGFHAVSILRVAQVPETGETRIYFLNPNNEGRQNWGQDIRPSVDGKGENSGESSLPFHHFAARIYAFHFNHLQIERTKELPSRVVQTVYELAKASWGQKYLWTDIPKTW